MSEYIAYAVKERKDDGSSQTLVTVFSHDPRRAFRSSLFLVKQVYMEKGLRQPMFEVGPRFYAEPVGEPVTLGQEQSS